MAEGSGGCSSLLFAPEFPAEFIQVFVLELKSFLDFPGGSVVKNPSALKEMPETWV